MAKKVNRRRNIELETEGWVWICCCQLNSLCRNDFLMAKLSVHKKRNLLAYCKQYRREANSKEEDSIGDRKKESESLVSSWNFCLRLTLIWSCWQWTRHEFYLFTVKIILGKSLRNMIFSRKKSLIGEKTSTLRQDFQSDRDNWIWSFCPRKISFM